ncbi:hypothetical protein [Tatumella sp. JGM118]|uniref:hypothetical protein n=1 Tax=Tatumella sp. JGM118 TaxID=2799796 RepID=UPI001BAFA0BD|nr:hypothetical protein [Tatumella sp. JGM118]MBS0909171.1 hypothetical protein [Tatumella sp. JGM118]
MSLNLTIECSDVQARGAMRPGKVSVSLEDCAIDGLTTEQQTELCGQMDFDVLVEYVNSFAEVKNVA